MNTAEKEKMLMMMMKVTAKCLSSYMPPRQAMAVSNDVLLSVQTTKRILQVPTTGSDTTAHLHYTKAGHHWYIFHRPDDFGPYMYAYGFAVLAGMEDCAELGDISITELVDSGVEMDLDFQPTPLSVIREQHGI